MESIPKSVISNQTGVHEDLPRLLARHQKMAFKRPIARHTQEAFEQTVEWLNEWQGELILDACCGVGESTINLAKMYPHARVVGVDKSISRLDKHHSYRAKMVNTDTNYWLVQADLNDFWRLLSEYMDKGIANWTLRKHCLFYPNPYPKKSQIGKRWYASALMPYIARLTPNIEVRSNWKLYLEEFLIAAEFYGLTGNIAPITESAITPFERKYNSAGQTCFKLVIRR